MQHHVLVDPAGHSNADHRLGSDTALAQRCGHGARPTVEFVVGEAGAVGVDQGGAVGESAIRGVQQAGQRLFAVVHRRADRVPFGVGRLEIELPESLQPEVLGLDGIKIVERDGRIFYPVIDRRRLPPLAKELADQLPLRGGPIRELAGGVLRNLVSASPRKAELLFLFRGAEPLEITLQFSTQAAGQLAPATNPRSHNGLLRKWWDEYTATPGLLAHKPDCPPLVENYLKAMLARRLELRLPEPPAPVGLQAQVEKQFGLATGTEAVRVALARDRMLGRSPLDQPADQPTPEPLGVPPLEIPEIAGEVAVESLAARVPAECLYVRFGSFSNFLWFQDMLAQWGGDLQNLVALRGLDYQTSKRFEEQLVMKTSVVSKLFGDAVVADVAIIGTDLLFQDGGAYGLLFEARNTAMLGNDIARQRLERVRKNDGIVEEKLTVADRPVSLLTTPDGSVRSYYVAEGNYHLVTTSKTLVQRFLQTDPDRRCLADSAGPHATVGQACSPDVMSLGPDSSVDDAVQMMREHALRRLPIVDGERPIGIVSLGDLAVENDPGSALGEISAAAPNG